MISKETTQQMHITLASFCHLIAIAYKSKGEKISAQGN